MGGPFGSIRRILCGWNSTRPRSGQLNTQRSFRLPTESNRLWCRFIRSFAASISLRPASVCQHPIFRLKNLHQGIFTRWRRWERIRWPRSLAARSSALIGFIIEDSSIGQIRFETWRHDLCCDGLLVWCPVGGKRVFYQITEGATREEALEGDRHGFQYGVASQLGELESDAGFVRNHWVPLMNTPVFWDADIAEGPSVQKGDFVYGTLPGTKVPIAGPFLEAMDHHTAILGVTGTGKTELAFDLIRHTVANGCKVICIDLTDRYRGRIEDLNPVDLSITAALADDLGKKLFDAETGAYGAGQEKKALKSFADKLRTDVAGQLKAFLVSKEGTRRSR